MCFDGDIWARQLECSSEGLEGQGYYCVERLSLLNVEAVEIFFMLMRDDFLLLFPRMPQVRAMYACLYSDLACVSNSQSSCVGVEIGFIVWYYSMTSSSLQA